MTSDSDGDEFENLDVGEIDDDITSGAELSLVRGERMNKAGVCRMLGKGDATVSKYIKEGMPVLRKGSRREGYEFDSAAVIAWLTKYAVELATGDPDTMSLEKAKRRLVQANARQRELEFAKASGETVFRKDIAAIADRKFGELRSRLVAIPTAIPTLSPEVEAILIDAINDAISDLSSPSFWVAPDGLILPEADGEEESESFADESEGDS